MHHKIQHLTCYWVSRETQTDVFVFDDSSQNHRYYDEAIDPLLRELHGTDKHFGQKDVNMGGEYGKFLPIVEKGSQATQFRMSFKKSDLWNDFKKYKLTKNERCADENWRKLLLEVRSGVYPSEQDGKKLPENITECNNNTEELQEKW